MNLYAHTVLVAVLLSASLAAHAAEPTLQPRQAVLLLRNKQVLQGEITPAGDYYLISLGKTGQIRLAAKEVEMVCRDLEEAYERKLAIIDKNSTAAHLELAEWCMKQSLFDQANAEITAVRQLDPKDPRANALEKRLIFERWPKAAADHTAPPTATVGAQQLDRTMKALPPGIAEQFTTIVQPILTDRCGLAKCHGVAAEAQFQLLQPMAGKVPSRRFTQRNLFATLSQVDKEVPSESQLLKMALKSHGHVDLAPFKSADDRQYRIVESWINSLQSLPKQMPPTSVNTAKLQDHQRQMGNFSGQPAEAKTDPPAAAKSVVPTRDPLDPEVFNRRYHKR